MHETHTLASLVQRLKLATYVRDNRARIGKCFPSPKTHLPSTAPPATPATGDAATGDFEKATLRDIGRIRQILDRVVSQLPSQPGDVVDGAGKKKLSRRPSFETLACDSVEDGVKTKGVKRGSSGNLAGQKLKIAQGVAGVPVVAEVGVGVDADGMEMSHMKPASITPEAAQNAFVRVLIGGVEPATQSGFPIAKQVRRAKRSDASCADCAVRVAQETLPIPSRPSTPRFARASLTLLHSSRRMGGARRIAWMRLRVVAWARMTRGGVAFLAWMDRGRTWRISMLWRGCITRICRIRSR